MKFAVTGGTGLVGRTLVPLLLERGHELRCLVRPRPGRELVARPGLEWIPGRLDEPGPVDELVHDVDAILHMAYLHPEPSPVEGRSDEEHWILTNYVGSMRLLQHTARARLRQFVYVSSLAVYGGDPNLDPLGDRYPRDEDFPLWPLDFYGAMRAGVEKMVVTAAKVFGFRTSVFRLGCVFGMRDGFEETPVAKTVDEALRHGEVRTTVGTYSISVEDAAAVLADALGDEGLEGGAVFNAFDRWVDWADAAPLVGRLVGRDVGVACEPAREPRGPILGERLRRRQAAFRTREAFEELVLALVRRRRGVAEAPARGDGAAGA